MTQKKKKALSAEERRAQRYQIEMRKKAKALADEIAAEEEFLQSGEIDIAPVAEDETPDLAEELKKQLELAEKDDIYYPDQPMMASVPFGPTSFEELDIAKEAQDQARELRKVSWDAEDLVHNILNAPGMAPKERAAAIKNVGAGFEQRISSILAEPIQKDLDALSLEAIIAHDKRNTNLVEQIVDKARMAMVHKEQEPYSLDDKAHTRAALVWAAKEIAEGGEQAAVAKEAMPLIRTAAKKFGIEMTMKKDRNAIVIEKDASGKWRWVGWVSNNFMDTDHDIIAEVAHKEYVGFLDANPSMMPSFLTWHLPGTARESLPDFAAYENGFLVMSGQLTEKEAESLLKAAQITDLGMSHGTLVFSRDREDPRVITKYRMYEVSDLPLENAANPFTALETFSKEADMDKLEYLTKLMGDPARAQALLKEQTQVAQEELTAAGVTSKDAKTEPGTTPATPAPAPASAVPTIPDHVMKEIVEKLDIPALSEFVAKANAEMEKIPVLEGLVKQLLAGNDEVLANMISPPAGATLAWSEIQKARASESDKNTVQEGDTLLENKPQLGWLSEATNTRPIPAGAAK